MSYTVLIVEDDDNLLEALTDTLSIAGYITKIAVNGEDALEILLYLFHFRQ